MKNGRPTLVSSSTQITQGKRYRYQIYLALQKQGIGAKQSNDSKVMTPPITAHADITGQRNAIITNTVALQMESDGVA